MKCGWGSGEWGRKWHMREGRKEGWRERERERERERYGMLRVAQYLNDNYRHSQFSHS